MVRLKPRIRAERGTAARRRRYIARLDGALHHLRRRVVPTDAFALAVLVAASVGVVIGGLASPIWVPPFYLVIPMLVGGFVLRMRSLLLLVCVDVGAIVVERITGGHEIAVGGVVQLLVAVAVIVITTARVRTRLGVQGSRGESLLFDLRDRLRAQGAIPALLPGWHADAALRSVGGQSFSGDFLVAARSQDGKRLELALVDVSGKGIDAGSRALQLSGAFGGLLGSLPSEEFLPAANTYLLRQEWDEGFATAVHLVVDLITGGYTMFNAGAPPVAQFDAGTGRWRVTGAEGPLLGVVPGARFAPWYGYLGPSDVLMLFTDGLVEAADRDMADGIDRLLGAAERLLSRGFHGGARGLIDAVAPDVVDDRALLVLWRD